MVFIVGYHHEPWADEAQCWLISRDLSYSDIFFNETKYEGHPFVWFFIEKTFIKIGTLFISSTKLYNWVFILPLFFSSVGVYLFLFKSNFPMIFKISFPFTFYIFYQYGVIARNHCLAFPVLALIATIYPKRFKHQYIYLVSLVILANVSAYVFAITCILAIFFIIDILKDKLGFKTVALQPYFENNIYNNYDGTSFYAWHFWFKNKYYKKAYEYSPVIVVANGDIEEYKHKDIVNKIRNNYNRYDFSGELRNLNYKNGDLEDNSYSIYIDKKLANLINN